MFKKLNRFASGIVLGVGFLLLAAGAYAQNQVMGELRFDPEGKVAKSAGVWIDGQYVGYMTELKGDKKVLLLPGEHDVIVREAGYVDSEAKIVVEAGQIQIVHVKLDKDPRVQYASETAEIKLAVTPDRAAVFLDGVYAGHVSEFGGVARAMLVNPGAHKIKIALTGYQTFDAELDLHAGQKYEVKTDLSKGSVLDAGPLMKQQPQPQTQAQGQTQQ